MDLYSAANGRGLPMFGWVAALHLAGGSGRRQKVIKCGFQRLVGKGFRRECGIGHGERVTHVIECSSRCYLPDGQET